jgi:hypothetical protein
MKKLILSLFGVALIATAVYAASTQIKNTGAGYQIGTAVGQKVGFYGAAPVVRQTVTNTIPVLATLTVSSATITYAGVDGSTNSLSVVTNVTINAIAGYSGTNQLNQVRNALVNLGLVSTDGN